MRYSSLIGLIMVFVFVVVGCADDVTDVDTAPQDETEPAGETADAIETESTDSTLNESELGELSYSCKFACFVGTECRSRCEEITVEAYGEWEEKDNDWVLSFDAEEVDGKADTKCAALYETICESEPLDLGWIGNGGPPGYDRMKIKFEIETELGSWYCSDSKDPCVCDHEATYSNYNDCHDVNEDTPVAWREICLESNQKSIEICGESQVCSPFEGPFDTQTCVDP